MGAQEYVGKSMSLHTRYPGHNGHQPVPGSPLGRVIDIIDAVFNTCSSTACLPAHALPLLSYWHADSDPKAFPPASASAAIDDSVGVGRSSSPAGAGGVKPRAEVSSRGGDAKGDGGVSADLVDLLGLKERGSEKKGVDDVEDPSLREDDVPSKRTGDVPPHIREDYVPFNGSATHVAGTGAAALLDEPATAGNRSKGADLYEPAHQRHRVQHHKNKWTGGHRNK